MARKGRKRLSADLPIVIYNQLKLMSQRRNITVTRYIIRLILLAVQAERELES